jgi:hypothetical protein
MIESPDLWAALLPVLTWGQRMGVADLLRRALEEAGVDKDTDS